MGIAVEPKRRGRSARRRERQEAQAIGNAPVQSAYAGGRYLPLTERDMTRIHAAVLNVLENVGLSKAIPSMVSLVTRKGGRLTDEGRLLFPRALVEDVVASSRRNFVLHGQTTDHDMELKNRDVYCGTGGASPNIVDFETGAYRQARLTDLYDIARLVDQMEHIRFYWRSVVATDMTSAEALDLNTAYACMSGTAKHIGVSFSNGANVKTAVDMFDARLGGDGEFRKRPFCTISCCHVVPPLTFAEESCEAFEMAVRLGMPALALSAGQAGATAPAALPGAVVQAVSEALAGLVFGNLIDPECKVILGTWPFVSDLRTGAMSGGSGEQALLMAACAQMGNFYDLPTSVAAGMTDAKVPDGQSGAEKGYTIGLAAHAGANMVNESAGMLASLLGTALESYVMDNDTLGAVIRTVRGLEVSDDSLSFDVIRDVTTKGPGHYLGHNQTLVRMQSDYCYPVVNDRLSPKDWEEAGALDARERARSIVRDVLTRHYPSHVDGAADDRLRQSFDIRLDKTDMRQGNGRW